MIVLRRYAPYPEPGDLTRRDLAVLFGLLRHENLVEVFFHDNSVSTLAEFLAFAEHPGNWFFAAEREGEFLGIGVINQFSSGGNTAHAHLVSLAAGRDGSFAEAGRLWWDLLRDKGGLETVLAVLPACYHGARRFAEAAGFARALRLPKAMRLTRKNRTRITDAVLYVKFLQGNGNGRGFAPNTAEVNDFPRTPSCPGHGATRHDPVMGVQGSHSAAGVFEGQRPLIPQHT